MEMGTVNYSIFTSFFHGHFYISIEIIYSLLFSFCRFDISSQQNEGNVGIDTLLGKRASQLNWWSIFSCTNKASISFKVWIISYTAIHLIPTYRQDDVHATKNIYSSRIKNIADSFLHPQMALHPLLRIFITYIIFSARTNVFFIDIILSDLHFLRKETYCV